MAYTASILKERVTILNRKEAESSDWGRDAKGVEWKPVCCVWASVDWARGKSAMNTGAIDVYGLVIVRMRWNGLVTMRSRIQHEGMTYQILGDTFHADKQGNTIQFHAQVIVEGKESN